MRKARWSLSVTSRPELRGESPSLPLVEPRPDANTQVDLVHVLLRDPGYGQEGAYPGPRAMTDLFQAGFHEEAVVAPQGDHVRHGAERHEVEILPQAGLVPSRQSAPSPQQGR